MREQRQVKVTVAATLLPRGVVLVLILAVLTGSLSALPRSSSSFFAVDSSAHKDAGVVSTATREGRLAVFDDVWQTVQDRYYTDDFHGVDWLAQRSLFRPLAADAHGARELYGELRRMLSSLQDAHTRVYAPEEKFDWQHPRFIGVGISLREVEGRPTVFAVEPGSAAERAGIRGGDVIETIDGESASLLLDRRLRELPSSTPRAAHLMALASLLDGPAKTVMQIKWTEANNREHQASLSREWQERSFALRSHQLANGVVVVEVDAFTQILAFEFVRTLRERLAHARGIIIDLRGNGGGDATAMAEIASAFLPPATRLGQFTDRHGNVALALETNALPVPGSDRIRKREVPVAILTSERTSSAAEILVAALKPGAFVVGGQTCGCVLAVRTRHALPDGGELDVSELDYRTAKGERLEGQGIVPDETVSLTRKDLYSHRDRLLESAIAKLRSVSRR